MRDEAWKRIGHLYPDATGPGGEKLTPIAWIWARTVESPDPTWHGHVPLVASWVLAKGPRKQTTWVEPIIDRADQTISYEIRDGGEPSQDRTVDRGGGTCLATGSAMPYSFLRPEFQRDSVGQSLMAIVAEGPRGRAYCAPTVEQEVAADSGAPSWAPSGSIFDWPGRTNVVRYGMERWEQLFTPRQLTALTTFSDLLGRVRERVIARCRSGRTAFWRTVARGRRRCRGVRRRGRHVPCLRRRQMRRLLVDGRHLGQHQG